MVYVGGEIMKKFKKMYWLILICIFTSCFNVFASTKTYTRTEEDYLIPDDIVVTESNISDIMSTPAVDTLEKIYDFADLFTMDEEEKLYDEVSNYINKYSLDMAIVTIDYNNKGSAMEYADDFYDYNLFKYDGLLLLIDMDTREIFITTTGDAISMYSDYRIDLILDGVYEDVSNEYYYDASSKFVKISSELAALGLPSGNEDYAVSADGTIKKDLHLSGIFIFALVGTIIIILIMVATNRMVKRASSSREYLNKSTMQIKDISTIFLGSNVSKVRISDTSSSGGSSTRSSSSGRSHGGGGRKF